MCSYAPQPGRDGIWQIAMPVRGRPSRSIVYFAVENLRLGRPARSTGREVPGATRGGDIGVSGGVVGGVQGYGRHRGGVDGPSADRARTRRGQPDLRLRSTL